MAVVGGETGVKGVLMGDAVGEAEVDRVVGVGRWSIEDFLVEVGVADVVVVVESNGSE